MYKSITSVTAGWAGSTTFEPGLSPVGNVPVLCCPATVAVGLVSAALCATTAYSSETSANTTGNNCTVDGCVGCVADSYACGGYVAPGRSVGFVTSVDDDASVELLLAAVTSRA